MNVFDSANELKLMQKQYIQKYLNFLEDILKTYPLIKSIEIQANKAYLFSLIQLFNDYPNLTKLTIQFKEFNTLKLRGINDVVINSVEAKNVALFNSNIKEEDFKYLKTHIQYITSTIAYFLYEQVCIHVSHFRLEDEEEIEFTKSVLEKIYNGCECSPVFF